MDKQHHYFNLRQKCSRFKMIMAMIEEEEEAGGGGRGDGVV